MSLKNKTERDKNQFIHLERSRLNNLFKQAARHPLVTVCAGAGYGKTDAVQDYARQSGATIIWIQLSEMDNVATHFWEKYTVSVSGISKSFATELSRLGFPDTIDKISIYISIVHKYSTRTKCILVFDDFHLIENEAVTYFFERVILKIPQNISVFLISRATPRINTVVLLSKKYMVNINENDLKFTESEILAFFRLQNISLTLENLKNILQDTEGWAFAINLIARYYQKSPGYEGYIKHAMKLNIFALIESEIWNGMSDDLKRFLVRLSLIEHLSVNLVMLLAKDDDALISEFENQNAYIRRDIYINAYLIHHLFLEFLRNKQEMLSPEERKETFTVAGKWCEENGFKSDALYYYDKIGDYSSIVSLLLSVPASVPQDIAHYACEIFERAPEEMFDRVELLAFKHVQMVMNKGLWQNAEELLKHYESKYLKLPEDDRFRNLTLGSLYYLWGILRLMLCPSDGRYDSDKYFIKQYECYQKFPFDPKIRMECILGVWISVEKGAPEKYIEALTCAVHYSSRCMNGAMDGVNNLIRGELEFYRGDISSAESHLASAVERAQEKKQYYVLHACYVFMLRIAVFQGNNSKVKAMLNELELLLNENDYPKRYIDYDIVKAWFSYVLMSPERFPDWLTEKFAPCRHPFFIENRSNRIKACYHYLVRNYPPLLAYINEQKLRKPVLLDRIVLLALEACVFYRQKKKREALNSLYEAYLLAAPNGLIMPFVELGKTMRSVTASALRMPENKIPKKWLEDIHKRAASYAKTQAHIIFMNKKSANTPLSHQEIVVLTDLAHGLSHTEISVTRGIAKSTVKTTIANIYNKLGVQNLPELIHKATEMKLI